MQFNPRRKLAIAAVVLAACSFAGGAYASTQESSTAATPKAFLNDVARRLGVTPQKLTAALDGAVTDQLNAAVKAGKLTQTQANAIERHVQKRGFAPLSFFGGPPLGLRRHLRFQGVPAPALSAAAKYLGISTSKLGSELRSGQSLRQIAKAHGKSVAGLRKAVTSAVLKAMPRPWSGPRFGSRAPAPRPLAPGAPPARPAPPAPSAAP
jgi:hypothetical protein